MKKNHIFILIAILQSCIPSDDLNLGRDVEIAVSFSEAGINLKGGNNIEVPMSQIIELKEDGCLTTDENGNYLFSKKSEGSDTTIICIGQGSLCEGTDDIFQLPLVEDGTIVFTPNKRNPAFGTAKISGSFWPEFENEKKKTSIKELTYVTTPMTIVIDINLQNVNGIETIDELKYEVPKFYDLVDESELTQKINSQELSQSHTIHIKGVNFKATDLRPGEYIGFSDDGEYIVMHGKVGIECTLGTMSIEDFKSSENPLMNVRIMVGTMGTTLVKGKFKNEEEVDISPITLDNLPDFLSGDEVELDVDNPIVRLSLNNEIPANIELNAEIEGIIGKETISTLNVGGRHGTPLISFDGAKKSSIWISKKPVETLPDSVKENIIIDEICNFIKRVPEKIKVSAFANTNEEEEVEISLAHEYMVIPSYELYAPLKMGPNMKIVYDKDIEDLNGALSHTEVEAITMTAEIKNNLPLNLSLSAIPYNKKGNELRGVVISMPQDIPPMGAKKVTIELRNAKGENAVKHIDLIKIKAKAIVTDDMVGSYLNVNQNLNIQNIKLTIKGK